MTSPHTPFGVDVPEETLLDLRSRLGRTRYPNQIPGVGWDQGTELSYLQELVGYWTDEFDWRAQEARINGFSQFMTTIDGQPIHFIHARSTEAGALPLVLSHGWPGSVVEFLDVIGPLTDPAGYGGDRADAFDVVVPSLPGYGFSGPTTAPGWHPRRMASAFAVLMGELGYDHYAAQGGDWGSIVSANLADVVREHVIGLHLNFVAVGAPKGDDPATLSPDDQRALAAMREWRRTGAGYQEIQGTKPQSLGYGLQDSPAGLAAWIVEKFRAWSDCHGDIETSFTKDQLLTNVMVYWVTGTATSSTRLYYEMRSAGREAVPARRIECPTGVANYPGEITRVPRHWVEARYNLTHWADMPRGGHFAAMEVPDLFVDDVRAFFRPLR